jgi:hypothetical protein
MPRPPHARARRAVVLTEPIHHRHASLRLLDGAGSTVRGDGKGLSMLDLLMVVLTVVAFASFFALVAWMERI